MAATGGAADRALGAGDTVGIVRQSVCIVIAARIAAAAAVCAGELCAQGDELLIFLNMENSGSVRKDNGCDQSDDDNEYDRNNDLGHLLTSFLTRTFRRIP